MPAMPFSDVLEAADNLSLDEQQTLLDILRRRIADRARCVMVQDVEDARREFGAGQCRAVSADELMREILS